MTLAALEHMHLFLPPVVHADERAVLVDRPGDRVAGNLEIGFDVAQQLERIFTHPVALVDEGEDRHAATLADGEQLPGAILDSFAIVEQHHRAVGGDECAVGVFGEVLVAGGVEQVDVIAVIHELHHARRDTDAALLFELHPVRRGVARRTPRLDRPGEVDRSPVEQELFREGRLPGVGVADDGKRPAGADGILQLLQLALEFDRHEQPRFKENSGVSRRRTMPYRSSRNFTHRGPDRDRSGPRTHGVI